MTGQSILPASLLVTQNREKWLMHHPGEPGQAGEVGWQQPDEVHQGNFSTLRVIGYVSSGKPGLWLYFQFSLMTSVMCHSMSLFNVQIP